MEKYHLNDLQPNCEHQTSFNCNKDYDRKSLIETSKCPYHYVYGSKWLVKEITDEEIDNILKLF